MATFFPHLYEYSQLVNSMKNDKKNQRTSKKAVTKEKSINSQRQIIQKNQQIIPHKTPTFTQYYQSIDIKSLLYLEEKVQKLRESTYNPMNLYDAKIDTILKEKSELGNIEKYCKPKEWPFEEQIKFPESGKHWMVCDAILCMEFAKTLPFFDKLVVDDQYEIIKSMTLFNTLLTSAYYSTTLNSNVLIYPDGHMPIKYPIMHKTHFDLYERIVEPVQRIKMTKEEYILLKIIIFCSTSNNTTVIHDINNYSILESPNITDEGKKLLEAELNYYNNLLLKLLQSKHGTCPGAVRYSQVIVVMEAIIYFAQKSREFYIWYRTSNWVGIPPLLLDEIIY